MGYESLLPRWRHCRVGDRYHVGVPGAWEDDVRAVLQKLIEQAQSPDTAYTPDDVAAELQEAYQFLARTPRLSPPAYEINAERETSLFQPTHVLPGRIVHIWYRIWDDTEFVWIRLEPNQALGRIA